jgi:1,2-diacylglycerol 3-alpha-glucosyltransferase
MMTNTYKPFSGRVERSIGAFTEEDCCIGHGAMIVVPMFKGMTNYQVNVILVSVIQNFNGTNFSVQLPIQGMSRDLRASGPI